MEWYLNGTLDSEGIKKHSSFWGKIESPFGKLNSNYGFIVFKETLNGMSQYDWCLKCFRDDIESRQAVINYNQPKHKYDGNKDFVCTLNQTFRVKEGKLNSRVFMRSTDLIFGFSYDIYWFGYLLRKLAEDLKLEVGSLFFYTSSMHIYERHFKILDSFVEKKND
jgi:thymidylate synthase